VPVINHARPGRERELTPAEPSQPDPRESMRVLPRCFQLPLTLLTGKPYSGQPALHFSATWHLATGFANLAAGVVITAIAFQAGGWWLVGLVPGWCVTLHGMRNLRMMIYHQCAHKNLYSRRRVGAVIGRLISSLLLVQNFRQYSLEHVTDHHASHHMTMRDPTVQAFLIGLDLHPGMTPSRMWNRVIGKIFSPAFHARFAVSRLRSFVQGSDPAERYTMLGLYGSAAAAASLSGGWPLLAISWLLPLFPFFQVSNTLRLCVKHTFPAPDQPVRAEREYFAGLTNAIFLGEATPTGVAGGRPVVTSWLRWFCRMAFIHFPARYLVLTGDTVCHDFHHRHPRARDWADYIFARQRDIDSGHPGWPAYREAWGLTAAINLVFNSLSAADPRQYDARHISSVSERELFAAFDD
jgi:fatty acid desaturase